MALGALMKPGIAACVNVLEVIADEDDVGKDIEEEEEWWEKGQWSDEETVWAVAVAGVVAGMVRLDAFLCDLILDSFYFSYRRGGGG